jgi:hypothetical protein
VSDRSPSISGFIPDGGLSLFQTLWCEGGTSGSAVHFGFRRVQRHVCDADEDIEFVAIDRIEGNAQAIE